LLLALFVDAFLRHPFDGSALFRAILVRLVIAGAVAGGLLWLGRRMWKLAAESERCEDIIRALPSVGTYWRRAALWRFSRVLGMAWQAGLGVKSSLELAGGASQSVRMERAAATAAQRIAAGEPFADSLAATGAFPAEWIASVRVGEACGALDTVLPKEAVVAEQAAKRQIDRTLRLLHGMLYGAGAAFAAYVVVRFYLGYLGQFADQ
jgi:type II secretory pathway component PulF